MGIGVSTSPTPSFPWRVEMPPVGLCPMPRPWKEKSQLPGPRTTQGSVHVGQENHSSQPAKGQQQDGL